MLLPIAGVRGAAFELVRVVTTTLGRYLNPITRLAWRRAELILVQNPETLDWLPRRYRHKGVVFPNALIAVTGAPATIGASGSGGPPTMLYAGRLLPWKGVRLAMMALELLPEWRLIICGSGADEARLRRLATRRRDLMERIDFRGWVAREELGRIMREEADVFVFPSLHDHAGFAVAEATAAGLPAVCLNRGGPRLVGAVPVEATTPRATAQALARTIERVRNLRPTPLPHREQPLRRLQQILIQRQLLASRDPRIGLD
jgi:glycosyltransferase involved in cell wall biosynthesis